MVSAVVTNGTEPFQYAWTVPQGATPQPNYLSAFPTDVPGEYSVTVTDANGETGQASASLVNVSLGAIKKPSWECTHLPAGEVRTLVAEATPNDRVLNWYVNGVPEYVGSTYSFSRSSAGTNVITACDVECTNLCATPLTLVVVAGQCLPAGAVNCQTQEGIMRLGIDCPEDTKGYVSFPDPSITGEACYELAAWHLQVTGATLNYVMEQCFPGGVPIPSDTNWWSQTSYTPEEICGIIGDLQGGWTTNMAEDCFREFCATGANELLPYFRDAMHDYTNAIWQIELAFNCTNAFDKTSALTNLVNNASVKQKTSDALDLALFRWGYNRADPQPTAAMTNALNSCLSTLLSNACGYLSTLTNAPACGACTP
jgi:hypothetical protein